MSKVKALGTKFVMGFVMLLTVIGIKTTTVKAADDFSGAVDISVNSDVSGNVNEGYGKEQNYYRFTLPSDGYVVLNLTHPQQKDAEEYWQMDLYNDKYEQLCKKVEVPGNTRMTSSPAIGLGAGTYYVKVISSRSWEAASTDVYALNVSYTASLDWEKELNDEFTSATEIQTGRAYSGSITNGYSYENDCYKFVTDRDGYVTLNFTNPLQSDSEEYWKMSLYNDAFEELCEQKVYGNVFHTESSTIGIAAGVYYIKITSSLSYDAKSTDTYTITADFSQSDMWEKEFNDDFINATLVTVGTEYFGTIRNGYGYEKDYFAFSVNHAGTYMMEIKTPNLKNNDRYWDMYLYNDKYEEMAKVEVYGNQTSHVITKTLQIGTYYIMVRSSRSWEAASTETYSIKVSENASGQITEPGTQPGAGTITDKSISTLKITAKRNKKSITVSTIGSAKVKITCSKKVFKNGKKTYTVYTNANGKATVRLSSKLRRGTKIKVTVSRSGYKTRTKTITVK